MKYFTFSFYIKSSNVPAPREAFPPLIARPRGSLMLPSSYLPHFVVLSLLMSLSWWPLNWALPKKQGHIYFIPQNNACHKISSINSH